VSASRALAHLGPALAALDRAGLLRQRPAAETADRVSFCSNDYLGLASVAGSASSPRGAGASRLVAGEHREHVDLERALAEWLGLPAALLFTSGYAANVGAVSALACSDDDVIISDALNHASLVDGCRLSRARTVVVPHCDLDAVRGALRAYRGRRWVVTESYFSMDADSPDLAALRALTDEHEAALYVDEAHALGVLGPEGTGLCRQAGITPDVLVGTLGKAFGAGGAFAAGCEDLTAWLWNRARSFVFSTGLSPALARSALDALRTVAVEGTLREAVLARGEQLREGLVARGFTPLGYGHIVPVVLGDAGRAVATARALRERGFDVQAIRPPSVPPGTARIRFTASARQSPGDIARLLDAIDATRGVQG
jgi:8-amino-7-oxononanoate synthase